VQMQGEARDGVFLNAHAGDEEAVDTVARAELKIDFAAGGKDEDAGPDVAVAVGVARLEAERVAGGGIDELRAHGPEGGVRAGIAEVPLELFADDFHVHGGERG